MISDFWHFFLHFHLNFIDKISSHIPKAKCMEQRWEQIQRRNLSFPWHASEELVDIGMMWMLVSLRLPLQLYFCLNCPGNFCIFFVKFESKELNFSQETNEKLFSIKKLNSTYQASLETQLKSIPHSGKLRYISSRCQQSKYCRKYFSEFHTASQWIWK